MSFQVRAVVGLLNVPTEDRRVLHPPAGAAVLARPYPLPVIGGALRYHRTQPRTEPLTVGWITEVRFLGNSIHVLARMEDTPEARDYAGALRLHAAGMVVDVSTGAFRSFYDPYGREATAITDWQVLGASIVRRPAWNLPPAQVTELARFL